MKQSTVYGYCRISTNKQSIDRQIRNIQALYPDAKIYTEAFTGTTINRPEWDKLRKRIKTGDTIVFDSVSRMSRNSDEGFTTYQDLFAMGVNLVFLKEPTINSSVYRDALQNAVPMTGTAVDCILEGVNKYLAALAREQIRLAFEQSEKEVSDLRQRTREGIETARKNGKQIGQKSGAALTVKKAIAAKEIIQKHSKDFGGSLSDVDCMTLAKCSRNSFYRYKRALKEEGAV